MATTALDAPATHTAIDKRLFRWTTLLLVAACWLSAGLFGAYILAFYGGAVPGGEMARWNVQLPGLYDSGTPLATAAIALHFVCGGSLLLLGPIQLVTAIRTRAPAVHRWTGRVYVASAGLAGLGGLGFVLAKGTIGGTAMDLGFGLYGALVTLAALQAWRHGYARRLVLHRAWAIRLFALVVGSWLYRMDYGLWLGFHGGGHRGDFRGPFDLVMDVFFYLPNLALAELYLRSRPGGGRPALRLAASGTFALVTGLILFATWFFTVRIWGPSILYALHLQPAAAMTLR